MPFPSLPSPPTLFPAYLIPSLPFRRRQSSTDSTDTALSNTTTSTPSSSPPTDSYLSGHVSHLRCARCLADLALSSQIVSKGFTGRHGRAYLVESAAAHDVPTTKSRNDPLPNLPNTYTHKPVPRQLVTGAHTVGDVSCAHCGSVLGWKYVAAQEEAQRYKVGKFILETKRIAKTTVWENDAETSDGQVASGTSRRRSTAMPPNEMPSVEFDSQDEEECEDLFLGLWTPQLAAKRRKAKLLEKR